MDLFAEHALPELILINNPQVREIAERYDAWRKLRYVARENGLNPEATWSALKFIRLMKWRPFDGLLRHEGGQAFGLSEGSHLLEPLHRIDRATGGGGPAALSPDGGVLGDETLRTRFRIRTLIDEAAESSIIEGAAKTHKDAVDLLRSGRSPKDKGERMIINNYLAMQQLKGCLEKELSVSLLKDMQRTLTEGTLDDPSDAGRFRRADENVRVVDERDGSTIFVPPPAEQIDARLKRLCMFANHRHEGKDFLHPVVKACILHFMLGYEHPFVDGNGRTARALFYWFALKHGYGIFEYLTISEIIRKGYARYPQAYIDTETDDGDLTYFVLYHLDVIEQALDRLAVHLKTEEHRIESSRQFLILARDLNLRQRLLLEHSLRHPHTQYTVKSHMNSNGISVNTARSDLEDLVRRRLMVTSKRVREVIYLVVPDLSQRLARKRRSNG
ncbi:MAG: Fic family protein [Phycisphaeraceae bacterium]|nr:Fic family protein [Phycisphaeraceae bacterium]